VAGVELVEAALLLKEGVAAAASPGLKEKEKPDMALTAAADGATLN
jgi:hypothetical protein